MPHERDDVLCDSCYFEDFDLVNAPDEVQIRACAQCDATHRGNRWVDVDTRDYTDIAIEEVSNSLDVHLNTEEVHWDVEPGQVDESNIRMHCHFSGVVRGTPLEESTVVPVNVARETCQHCDRVADGYFASLVQVHADDWAPITGEAETTIEIAESYIAGREDKGGRNALIAEVNRTPDGLNIRISTDQMGNSVAKQIREHFGGTIEECSTSAAEDGDGNKVYRVTLVVHLPRYIADDVINPEDGGGSVPMRSNCGRFKGMRLASDDLYESESEEDKQPEAEDPGSVRDVAEITVVTVEDEHAVQVLDPETYEAKAIPWPNYFDLDALMVSVLKSPSGSHVFLEEVVNDDGE